MLLFELMNKVLPTKMISNTPDEVVFEFDVPDGRVYMIEYERMNENPPAWEVNFRDVSDTSKDQFELTNKGSEIPILVTSFANVAQFVKANPNDAVFFTADSEKRASVYGKLLGRVGLKFATGKNPEGKTEFYVGNPEAVAAYQQVMNDLNTPR